MAFTDDLGIIDLMLSRMFGTADDGLADRLLGASRPVEAAYHFAPSTEAIDAMVA